MFITSYNLIYLIIYMYEIECNILKHLVSDTLPFYIYLSYFA